MLSFSYQRVWYFVETPIYVSSTTRLTLVVVQGSLEGLVLLRRLAIVGLLLAKTVLGASSCVRVEAEQDLLVLERVLLLDVGALGNGTTLDGTEDALDFAAVDELADVGLGDQVGGRRKSFLSSEGGGGAVDGVECREGGRGPDDEAAEVATGSELEQVQAVDGGSLDAGDVAEGGNELLAILLGLVDDQGAATLLMPPVPQLTLTGAELARSLDLLDVRAGTDGLEQSDGGRGLLDGVAGESGGRHNERDLGHGADVVTAGEEEGGGRRCGNGRSSCETLLVEVDLLVPLAPDLGRGEHATAAALVTEGGLTGTVSTTTRDTGNTGDSATCVVLSLDVVLFCFSAPSYPTYRYPTTRHWSGGQPSRSRHTAASCS